MKRTSTVVLLLVFVLVLALALGGCGGSGGSGTTGDADTGSTDTGGTDTGGTDTGGTDTGGTDTGGGSVPRDANVLTAIDAAVTEGSITPGQGLLYKLQAIYEPDQLPARFQGLPMARDGDGVARQAISMREGLSSEERAAVEPYLAAPFRVGSWWDLRQQRLANRQPGVAGRVTNEILTTWNHVDTLNGKARVWFLPANAATAEVVRAAVDDDVWPKLQFLTGREPLTDGTHGGDGRLDIIVLDIAGGAYGVADVVDNEGQDDGTGCGGRAAYVEIDIGHSDNVTRSTVAHELFHAWQFSYPAEDCDRYCWLAEGTATWAEDYVYPDYNREHEYMPGEESFLYWPESSLNAGGGGDDYNYGSYLFFQYLARAYAPVWIKTIWEHAASGDSVGDLDAALKDASGGAMGLAASWSEFSRYLWNQNTEDRFARWDAMSLTPKVAVDPITPTLSAAKYSDRVSIDLRLPHLSSQYYPITFPDDSVSGFTFVNGWSFTAEEVQYDENPLEPQRLTVRATPLPEEDRKKRAVWLMYRLEDGEWQTEELTHRGIAYFCRDRVDGRVREAVLVFANGDHEVQTAPLQPTGAAPFLRYDNLGCYEWTGSVEVLLDNDVGGEAFSFSYLWGADDVGYFTSPAGMAWVVDPGLPLSPLAGNVTWRTWGTWDKCTISGEEIWPLDAYSDEDQIVIDNFVLAGEGERTLDLFLGSIMHRSVTQYTTGDPSCAYEFTYDLWTYWLHVTPDQPEARVSDDGKHVDMVVDSIQTNLTARKEWE